MHYGLMFPLGRKSNTTDLQPLVLIIFDVFLLMVDSSPCVWNIPRCGTLDHEVVVGFGRRKKPRNLGHLSWPTRGALAMFVLGSCRRLRPRHGSSPMGLLWAEPETSWFGRLFQPDTSIFKQTRQYSTPDALDKAYQGLPLDLKDLSRKNGPNVPATSLESPAYRIVAFSIAFMAYPGVVRFLRQILQLGDGENVNDLADVVTDFVTVETFVFGSYSGVTLTLQIQRLAELQTNCVRECALLSGLAEHTVELFDSLPKGALPQKTRETVQHNERKALKALWHHTERLAFSTRGEELMDIADRQRQDDSISNYRLALLKWGRTRREDTTNSPLYEQDLQLCLSMVNQLKDFRAGRLSRESLILPPTFYWTFGLLSIFITISFTLREAADPNSEFSIVDRCFFSTLTLAFLTLFRFAIDMNYPFKGDYQIRRGTISAELISARRTIQNALGEDMEEIDEP